MNIDTVAFIFGLAYITVSAVIFYCSVEILRRRVSNAMTVLLPDDESLRGVCEDVAKLDLESKCRILQSCLGHNIDVVVSIDSVNASIKGCAVSGADLSAMMQNDVSVG